MNRRGFIKGMVAAAVTAALPIRVPKETISSEATASTAPANNPLFAGEIGRYEGFSFIESHDLGGGYMMTESQSERMIRELRGKVVFRG